MSEGVALRLPLPGAVVTCFVTGSGISPPRIWGPSDQSVLMIEFIALEWTDRLSPATFAASRMDALRRRRRTAIAALRGYAHCCRPQLRQATAIPAVAAAVATAMNASPITRKVVEIFSFASAPAS